MHAGATGDADTGGSGMRNEKFMEVVRSAKTFEWPTPDYIFQLLDREYGPFTLDPCATPENAKTAKFFTQEDNGLSRSWAGERVFMNPPYGRSMGEWMRKASSGEAYTVCLVPARTDTKWWHTYVGDGRTWLADEVRFWKGRIQFGDSETNAPFPSVIIVFKAKP